MEREKHGKPISKDEFEKMRKLYQDKNPKKTHAVLFHHESVKRILDTPGAVGVRIHFGINEDGDDTVMLSASDENGASIYATLEDRGQLCPPYC